MNFKTILWSPIEKYEGNQALFHFNIPDPTIFLNLNF